ncbi:hypothetical protein [Sphingosinicella sp. LY1275]|uniref:hypothetical protein n=1 Tax=Sphingosinicella sp. LY1275 TaxID=3095379 RepID=UPI002ADEF940|nr:hypothetical protein [Sphingosinicella sp. LY1275]MEA1016063.1 hypothetical protein [Sphingosinicella sp. LY1275]
MRKKLLQGLGASAALVDAGVGYLTLKDKADIDSAEKEFVWFCTGVAAEFLRRYPEPLLAKQAVRAAIRESMAAAGHHYEAAAIDQFAQKINAAIDDQADRSEWRRTLTRLASRIPFRVKGLIIVVFGVLINLWLGKVIFQ